jgi:hypothetical protein
MKRFVFVFLVLALAVASAKTYTVTLFQPAVVGGTELQPGEYKLDVQDTKVIVLKNGKQTAESSVKVETSESKYSTTSVRYTNGDGKYRVQEIRLGGTKTKLVFN